MGEIDLGIRIIEWLSKDRWEVYQEVACGGYTADIVALDVPKKRHWIIELKLKPSLLAISQAMRWVGAAELVSLAVAGPVRSSSWPAAHAALEHAGVGLIYAMPGCDVTETTLPRWENSRPPAGITHISHYLVEEQKEYARAGNADGKRYTAWRQTCDRVTNYIKENGPTRMGILVREVDHHYSSPKSAKTSLTHWIRAGRVSGIEIVRVLGEALVREKSDEPLQLSEVGEIFGSTTDD